MTRETETNVSPSSLPQVVDKCDPHGNEPFAGMAGGVDGRLDADLRDHLGAHLRAMFQDIVNEPLPERFQRLFDELARKGQPTDEQP